MCSVRQKTWNFWAMAVWMTSSSESLAWPGQNWPEWLWCEKGILVLSEGQYRVVELSERLTPRDKNGFYRYDGCASEKKTLQELRESAEFAPADASTFSYTYSPTLCTYSPSIFIFIHETTIFIHVRRQANPPPAPSQPHTLRHAKSTIYPSSPALPADPSTQYPASHYPYSGLLFLQTSSTVSLH